MNNGFFTAHDGANVFFEVDDFTDGWRKADAVVCIHGLAESTQAWNAWVPHLARDFRVIRFDTRGFGKSTVMPADHRWSLQELMQDIDGLYTELGLEKAHLIAWKSGGAIAMGYASCFPQKVHSLSVIGSHPVGPAETWIPFIEEHGVERWLRETMPRRLASVSPEAVEWWIALMAKTAVSTLQGYLRWYPTVNLLEQIRNIQAPTLVLAGNNPLRKSDEGNEWHKRISRSTLKVLPVESSHLGGAFPDMCAKVVAEFIRDNRCHGTAKGSHG